MNYEPKPHDVQIEKHFELLESRLATVPELSPAFEFLDTNPEYGRETYQSYIVLISRMSELREDEQATITQGSQRLQNSGGVGGSASAVTAVDILTALGDHKSELSEIGIRSTDTSSPHYNETIEMLVEKLTGGHQLKLIGKVPSDSDPESLKVIWGHTQITGPEALVHFVTCHYLGLFFQQEFTATGYDFAKQKDFLINAMTDIVILDRGTSNDADERFKIWNNAKDSGGLGWISPDRLKSIF